MNYLSIEEVIKRARERKVDLGRDPHKIIRTCANLGLIPKPKRKRSKDQEEKNADLYFPESTVDRLAQIKSLKSEGLTLDEIRDSFALEYVETALRDLLSSADDDKVKQLADIIGSQQRELEAIVEAPLIYLVEGMSEEEAKELLTLFFGVGFYSMLEAQQSLEELKINEARKALFKAIFYNSIAVLRLSRATGDEHLEETASEVYDKAVLEPLGKASESVREEFISSVEAYLKEKGFAEN